MLTKLFFKMYKINPYVRQNSHKQFLMFENKRLQCFYNVLSKTGPSIALKFKDVKILNGRSWRYWDRIRRIKLNKPYLAVC